MSNIWGILLAAGNSTRFGTHKLLHPLADGTPVGVVAARRLLHALPNSIAVVREHDAELIELLAAEAIGIVINPDPARGLGSSLACGVGATATASGWVIALADMPGIQPKTIQGVTCLLQAGAPVAAPVYRGERGHPVGFSHVFRPELERLAGDQGAREILIGHAEEVQHFEVDDSGILIDIDHDADLAGCVGTGDGR
jgi:molybdenum cofactor cytidylyltransferase